MRKLISLALLLAALIAGMTSPAIARDWQKLGGDPLQNPYDPAVIRRVIHKMSVFPASVADALVAQIITGHGRAGTVCIGDHLAAMSFGHERVWDEPVTVAWTNTGYERCKPATFFDFEVSGTVYTALRIHACRNLGALYPRRGMAPPPSAPGPILGLIPQTNCPPHGAVASCC